MLVDVAVVVVVDDNIVIVIRLVRVCSIGRCNRRLRFLLVLHDQVLRVMRVIRKLWLLGLFGSYGLPGF